jgi:hypothetical protein
MEPEYSSPFFYRCQLKASRRNSGEGMIERKGTTISGKGACSDEIGIDRAGEKQDLSGSRERSGSGMLERD